MALGSLNLRVSKGDFEKRIAVVEIRMGALVDVINRYENAKANLDQFIESNDNNYDNMVKQIDVYIKNAKKAHSALNATKLELQSTVEKMANMGNEVKETIVAATDATVRAVEAAIKIDAIL